MELYKSYKDNCGFGLLANINNIPTHETVKDAITSLENMIHRGAIAADGKSGDGSGFLFSLPVDFMKEKANDLGVDLPEQFAVAMVFFTKDEQKEIFENICEQNDLKVLLYRDVPINTEALGELALKTLPKIVQVFVVANSIISKKRFEALLYLTRKIIEKTLSSDKAFYIPSFSNSVISYKGLVMPTHLREFYTDLQDQNFKAVFALFHQRFSTNTLPEWRLAQPFRTLAHNGEINSVSANRFNIKARSEYLKSTVFSDKEIRSLLPITRDDISDSASLDNVFEFLIANGYDFFKAARVLIPAPWQNAPHVDSKLRAFYEYASNSFEPWDGPAAISLTNGRYIACILDRNGLRPAKYIITKDKRILISSEYGVMHIEEENIKERGRLQSGEMIGVDLKFGKVLKNSEINDYLKNTHPYTDWLNKHMIYLQEYVDILFANFEDYELGDKLPYLQRYNNITAEVKDMIISPMIKSGKESTGSMGDDTPIAAFSEKHRCFTDFFKQKFAQVTNPPIDSIREMVVMSLTTDFGQSYNILDETPGHANRIKSISPILSQERYDILKSFGNPNKPIYKKEYKCRTFRTLYEDNLRGTLEDLVYEIVEAVKNEGIHVIFLDDRGLDKKHKCIPMAMLVGRVNNALLDNEVRHKASIIAVTGEVFDSHSCACMISFGASAIYPYLLYASVLEETKKGNLDSYETKESFKNVVHALNQGLLKIISKMGIATIASYRNSALFDTIGLSEEIVNDCFRNTHSLLSGLTYDDIEARIEKIHEKTFEIDRVQKLYPLELGGYYKHLENGEYHDYGPKVIHAIHKTALTGQKCDYEALKELINNRKFKMIRDFFEIKSDKKPINISKVEPLEKIFKRF
ncbi:MAG: glutamate synthase central domain-containing protein, partial [Campylobacteraceae bacterium]